MAFVAGFIIGIRMKKRIFEGIGTALVTPFKKDGKVDYDCLKRLIERQIRLNADAVILCGTTGEAPTLSDYEHKKIIETGVNYANGKIPVISGCGSNDTAHAIKMAKFSKSVGADGGLLVTPYYNKTTQNGLIAHYFKIFDSVDLPFIVYNVPSRTGVNIEIETYNYILKHQNCVGVKESSDSLKILSFLTSMNNDVAVYAGNDDSFLPVVAAGGKGVISVISNLIPDKLKKVYKLVKNGETSRAKTLYGRYYKLINLMFSVVNPIPLKYAMSTVKLCDNWLRAPLFAILNDEKIDKELQKLAADIII